MVSRISTGVTEGNVRGFSIIKCCSLLPCLVEPLIQLSLSHVLWYSILRHCCTMWTVIISCTKNMSLLQAFYSIRYQLNAIVNRHSFLNTLLIFFTVTEIFIILIFSLLYHLHNFNISHLTDSGCILVYI